MNETLNLIKNRKSVRRYSDETPVTSAEKQTILTAAASAPTGGNMSLYTIIDITDQANKDELAILCDNQPFIARAPLVLIFAADWHKWTTMFRATGRDPRRLGLGDLMLAHSDALIAAQTAVIAAEALGIGSCYIGDVIENGPHMAQLLNIPIGVIPSVMVVFGHPHKEMRTVPKQTVGLIHKNGYSEPSPEELLDLVKRWSTLQPSGRMEPGAVHDRKFASNFMTEMNSSMEWWLERWSCE